MNKNKKSVLEMMFGGLHKKISEALTPEEYTELTHKAATLSQDETLAAVQATTGIGAATGTQTATPPAPTAAAIPAPQAAAQGALTQTADPMQAVLSAVQALTQKVDGIVTKQATYDNYFKTAQNAGVALPGADASSRGQQPLANVAADSPMGVAAEIWRRNNPQG